MNLEAIVAGRLIYWGEQIVQQVNSKWTSKVSPGITGNKEIIAETKANSNIVITELIAYGQAAWEIEFGKGSLMDRENPYLQKYLISPEVNQWRFHSSRLPITGRSAGEYKDLDGNAYISSGRMQGLDLERDGKPEYQPVMPMHVIRDEIKFTWPLIVSDINNAISTAVSEEIVMSLTKDIYI